MKKILSKMNKSNILTVFILILIIAIIGIFVIINSNDQNQVIEITSTDRDNILGIKENIVIQTKYDVNEKDFEKILKNTFIKPVTLTDAKREGNKIIISPKTNWDVNTQYELKIKIAGELVTNFKSKSLEELNQEEIGIIDQQNNQNNNQIDTEDLWKENFPILNDNYIMIYDEEGNFIRIRVFNATQYSQEELEAIQDGVRKKLEEFNVPTDVRIDFILDQESS
jgi:hypothetical protein